MNKAFIRVLETLATLLLVCIIFSFGADAAKNTKKTPKKKITKQVIIETPEQKAERLEKYRQCVIESKAIETEYYIIALTPEQIAKEGDDLDTDEFLYRVYLRTVKWDKHGCFAHKDVLAAKRVQKSLKEYVIGGVNPDFKERLRKLVRLIEEKDCGELKCKFGITSAFRDNYRQQIAEGYKASACNSFHGGTCRTKGWGDGRAVDVVNVSLFDLEDERRWQSTEQMWKHIDTFVGQTGLHRPLKAVDPMHLEFAGTSKPSSKAKKPQKKKWPTKSKSKKR